MTDLEMLWRTLCDLADTASRDAKETDKRDDQHYFQGKRDAYQAAASHVRVMIPDGELIS